MVYPLSLCADPLPRPRRKPRRPAAPKIACNQTLSDRPKPCKHAGREDPATVATAGHFIVWSSPAQRSRSLPPFRAVLAKPRLWHSAIVMLCLPATWDLGAKTSRRRLGPGATAGERLDQPDYAVLIAVAAIYDAWHVLVDIVKEVEIVTD